MRYRLFAICATLALLSCARGNYIVEKNPNRHNPVDEVAWLKEHKKEWKNRECRITLYEKEGKNYYAIFVPTPGAKDLNITTIYDENGEIFLKYGGPIPPQKKRLVNEFYQSAIDKGVIWECRPKGKKDTQEEH